MGFRRRLGSSEKGVLCMGSSEKGRRVSDDVCDGAVFSTVACVAGYTVFAADARQYGNEGQILLRRGFKVV